MRNRKSKKIKFIFFCALSCLIIKQESAQKKSSKTKYNYNIKINKASEKKNKEIQK